MKKKLFILITLICVILIGAFGYNKYSNKKNDSKAMFKDENFIEYMSKVDAESFYIYKDNKWQKEFIKGVNLGAAKPEYFPG